VPVEEFLEGYSIGREVHTKDAVGVRRKRRTRSRRRWKMVRKVLLVCGIMSSLLYVAMNVFVPLQWEGGL
jgi:hypothetical protein